MLLRFVVSLLLLKLSLLPTLALELRNADLFGLAQDAPAQDESKPKQDESKPKQEESKPKEDPPSEGFYDNLRRMKIKRAEEEHKKRVADAKQAVNIAESLAKEVQSNSLNRAAEKKLKDIEKAAKRIRSDAGGSDDDKALETPPATLEDALKQLCDVSKRLNDEMGKTSRHIISAAVIADTSEMIRLVKVIRGYIN